jgi:hypothetical protein
MEMIAEREASDEPPKRRVDFVENVLRRKPKPEPEPNPTRWEKWFGKPKKATWR